MNQAVRNNTWVVILTLTVALLLDILPMPSIIAPYWPKWVALVLLYWSLALPHRYGLITAWVTGLFVDALEGTLLGLHGLCFFGHGVFCHFVVSTHSIISKVETIACDGHAGWHLYVIGILVKKFNLTYRKEFHPLVTDNHQWFCLGMGFYYIKRFATIFKGSING